MSGADIDTWPLMSSGLYPTLIILVSFAALAVSQKIGREEWQEPVMAFMKWYNLVSSVVNWYMLFNCIRLQVKLDYNLLCEATSKSGVEEENSSSWWPSWFGSGESDADISGLELQVAETIWNYLAFKIFEFIDPICFALQQYETANRNIIHHSMMVGLAWYGLKYIPGGSTLIWITISNGFLAIAYTFQTVMRFDTDNEEYWKGWKGLIIFLKHSHFVLSGAHCVTVICSSCGYPKTVAVSLLAFLVFYVSSSLCYGGGGGNQGGDGGQGGGLERERGHRIRDDRNSNDYSSSSTDDEEDDQSSPPQQNGINHRNLEPEFEPAFNMDGYIPPRYPAGYRPQRTLYTINHRSARPPVYGQGLEGFL